MFHGGYLAEALLVPEMREFSLAVLTKKEEDSHADNAEEQEDEML